MDHLLQLHIRYGALGLAFCWLGLQSAHAQHYDVELRTSGGPVAGSRIVTEFYGDLGLAGRLPIDGQTGYQLFPAYFGDFAGGPMATANPGFQAFAGTFLAGEQIHFRAIGTLQHWSPETGAWGPAPEGVTVALYGGIPAEVIIGYATQPSVWAEQYAYYQAGTRYSRQGVQGPLTALVDDASANGSFHSHLDWKISAASGQPAVGAYMVTLELWSPALAAGQAKYQPSHPVQVIFEYRINQSQMDAAFDARITPPPMDCAATTLAWTAQGQNCSAAAPQTASGASRLLEDLLAPATGSATFACSNGSWGPATQASCSVPVVEPAACAAQAVQWTVGGSTCAGTLASGASGSAQVVTASGTGTGSAAFSCSDGTWSANAGATCTVPPVTPLACSAGPVQWSVGNNSCTATLPALASGTSQAVTDLQTPTVGSASFACSAGVLQVAAGARCSSVTGPASAPVGTPAAPWAAPLSLPWQTP